jgi:hypothetical protein
MNPSITTAYLRSAQSITSERQHDETWGRGLGDYARGQRTRRDHAFVQGDFATGMRTTTKSPATGDFATGMRTTSTPARIGDFATGMRTQPLRLAYSHAKVSGRSSLPIAA